MAEETLRKAKNDLFNAEHELEEVKREEEKRQEARKKELEILDTS